MKRFFLFLVELALIVPAFAVKANAWTQLYVDAVRPDDGGDGLTTLTAKKTIQAAIDAASNGDTINVAAGTYVITGRITVGKELYVRGESESTTTIDASANGLSYGVLVTASNTTLTGFTIIPPEVAGISGTSSGGGYAIHVSDAPSVLRNVTIEYITVRDGNRTGIDVNSVDSLTVRYVTSQNAAYGNGVSLTGVHGALLSHITTGGNAWGGIAVYCSKQSLRGSDSVTIDGPTCTVTETNRIYSQDEFGLHNSHIVIPGYDYTVLNSFSSDSKAYVFYQDDLGNAVTMATVSMEAAWTGSSPYSTILYTPTHSYRVGTGMRIQTAVDSAAAGDSVIVSSGTFDETVDIGKRIVLKGAGSGTSGTVLESTVSPTLVSSSPYSFKPVVMIAGSGISGSPLLLRDLLIRPRNDLVASYQPGVLLSSGEVSYLELENVRIVGTKPGGVSEAGLTVSDNASLEHFTASNCEFKDMSYGVIFYKNSDNLTFVRDVSVSYCAFDSNAMKGLYAEKLSQATFADITVIGNGDTTLSPSWAIPYNTGIDINLKYVTATDLDFTRSTFSGNGTGSSGGAGLSVKARGTGDDASYSSTPATLDGLTVSNCVFTGNYSADLRIGEPGKDNSSPSVVDLNNNVITGGVYGVVDSRAAAADTIDATGNWWGSADGPDDNSGDGTASHNSSTGAKIFEPADMKIAYAPWYSVDPDDEADSAGVNQTTPKLFTVDGGVAFASKGIINRGISLASTVYVDTIDVMTSTVEAVVADRKVFLRFAVPPSFDSMSVDSGELEVTSEVTVKHGLKLDKGNIVTKGNGRIVLDTTAAAPLETSRGKIIGKVEVKPRTVGKGSLQSLGLHIEPGADNLGKVGFTRMSGDGGIVTVSGNSGIAMTWQINTQHQPSGGRTVVFSWLRDFDNGVDTSAVIVYRNEGAGWKAVAGPFDVSGQNPREITVTATGFSDWTMGSSGDMALPVQASGFTAKADYEKVTLAWRTESEFNNAGFNIRRKDPGETDFKLVSSFLSNDALRGVGSSSSGKGYVFTDTKVEPGLTYRYIIESVSTTGQVDKLTTLSVSTNRPAKYELYQNYPNPFNPATTVAYDLPRDAYVEIILYDLLGRKVSRLVAEGQSAGRHKLNIDGGKYSSGVYFYVMTAKESDGKTFSSVRRMVLVK